MKTLLYGISAALIGVAMLAQDAEAARVGGGRSVGSQRSITSTPPSSAPARQQQQVQQAAPSQQQNAAPTAANQPTATPKPAPATGLSRWMPMLGGLALGGLLGALIGGSGLGSMLMSWLLIAAVVFGVVLVVRMVMAKRAGAGQPMQYAAGGPQGTGYGTLGNETVAAPPPSQLSGFEPQAVAAISSNLPAGFDVAGFVRAAKLNFMKLQLANDSGNIEELREFTTPELFGELKKDIAERGGAKQQTDVVSLNADLLEVVTEGSQHWASVRFSGMIREHPASAPESFEEVWNLAKPLDGSTGWLLAGIQQTH